MLFESANKSLSRKYGVVYANFAFKTVLIGAIYNLWGLKRRSHSSLIDRENVLSYSVPMSEPTSQWQRLLKNNGTWQGSFTQLSPDGLQLSDTPTEVALLPYDENRAMRQEIRRYPQADYQGQPSETVLDYRSLSRSTLFFEDGAFSQGSTQWGSVSYDTRHKPFHQHQHHPSRDQMFHMLFLPFLIITRPLSSHTSHLRG